ncbi:MAG: oligosaccharide flippase family protein [Bacteroidales bacterium]|nr:oligosaccharide flippase family protein [Bacteroidales bacterium]
MNPIKQLFGQTAVYGMGIVIPRLLNYLLLTPFYTRIFETGEYGVITELYAYVVFLLVVLTYGMETGFFRFSSNRHGEANTVYSSVLLSVFLTSSLFVILVFSFIKPVSEILGYGYAPHYIKWLILIVSLDAFTAIPFARIRLLNKPVKYTIIRISEVFVNIGLNWFFLFYCAKNGDSEFVGRIYNPDIGVGYVLISNLAASILKVLLLSTEIMAAFKGRLDVQLLKGILKYSYPLLIAGLAGTINEALDRVLLKHLIDPADGPMTQLGIYGANYKIAVMMTLYVQMFKYAAEPFFFGKANRADAKQLYGDVMMFFVMAGLMIFLVVMLYIDYFKLFIGIDFREGIGIVPVILLANLVMGIFFNLSIWYKLTNRTLTGALLVTIGAIITIVVNVIFVPVYGYFASAWGHLLCYTVMVILSFLLSRKHYKIPYDFKRILIYIAIIVSFYLIDKNLETGSMLMSHLVKLLLIFLVAGLFFVGEKNRFQKYRFSEINDNNYEGENSK